MARKSPRKQPKYDFDKLRAKGAFRVAQTPPGRALDYRTNQPLPHDPNIWSIVTPLNTQQQSFPTATPKAMAEARKDFNNMFTDRRVKYKGRQIKSSAKMLDKARAQSYGNTSHA